MRMPSYQENKSLRGQGRGETTYPTETAPPYDEWFFIEWEFNDDPSAITFWIDGEKDSETPMNGQKVDTVTFDWPKGSGIRYDDIAIGTSRLGPVK